MCRSNTLLKIFLSTYVASIIHQHQYITEHQMKLHKKKVKTVHTKRLDRARDHLHSNRLLILVGKDGDGLTTLGKDILDSYKNRQPFIVKNIEETYECLIESTDENFIIVLVDDVFGTNELNKDKFESWSANMERIEAHIDRDSSIMLILVINSRSMENAIVTEFYGRRYRKYVLNISDPEMQLDVAEMQGILKSHITSEKGIKICENKNEETLQKDESRVSGFYRISKETIATIANTALKSGFPKKVEQFVSSPRNLEKGIVFFNAPTPELVKTIEKLRLSDNEKDQGKYISLVAVFVYGELNLQEFERDIKRLQKSGKQLKLKRIARSGGKKSKYPELLHILVAIAKEKRMLSRLVDVVRSGVQLLLGEYLQGRTDDYYLLASASIETTVAMSCAKQFPVDICRFSSQRVFDCIFGPDLVFDENEVHISVNENDNALMLEVMQRLQRKQLSNKLTDFLQHPAMRCAWFAKRYIMYTKGQKHGIKALIRATDENGRTNETSILTLSLNHPYKPAKTDLKMCLTYDLISSKKWRQIRKKNPEFANKQSQCILEKCCELNSPMSFSHMLDTLNVEPPKNCLFIAVERRWETIITELSDRDFFTAETWYQALKQASVQLEKDDRDAMKIIFAIKQKIEFDYQSESVESIIHTAGRQGDIDLLSKVVKLYNNKNLQNDKGQTCIHIAVEENHFDFVKLAFDYGISQRIHDKEGKLPIHIACEYGYLEIVKLLVSNDDGRRVINFISNTVKSPLHIAAVNNHNEIVSYLKSKGAKCHICIHKPACSSVYRTELAQRM